MCSMLPEAAGDKTIMKDYRRKQVTIEEVESYSKCPRYYQLNKDIEPKSESHADIFNRCIREAVIHMYAIELTTGHKAEFHSIKSFWDKVFWKNFPEDDAKLALEYSEKGIDILHRHFRSTYSITKSTVSAIKAPHDYLMNCEKIGIPVELGIVLVDHENKDVYLVDFIDKKDFPTLKSAAIHSMEPLIKMASIKQETPDNYNTKATFYDASDISSGVTVDVPDRMFKKVDSTIKFIVAGIDNNVYYSSKTCMCANCDHKKQCSNIAEEDY